MAAAAVLLVNGCLSHLMVGFFGVGSLALQRALARSDVVRVVVMPISVLVGCARVGLCTTHGGACCVGALPASWWVVRCWCLPAAVVVRGVVVLGLGCRLCRLASLGSGWWCFSRRHAPLVLLVQRHRHRLTVGVFGWLWSAVGLQLGFCCLIGTGWCCAGAWPPSWWSLLRWCVAPPMVGCAVLVRAPRPLWGVLCCCMAPPMVGRAMLVCGPPHGRPCCVVV